MVRLAQIGDLDKIATFAERYKQEKELFTDSEFIKRDFKQFLLECQQTSSIRIFVSEQEGEIRGFLIMSIDRVPWNKNKKWASDVLFAAEREAAQLLKTGIGWAKSLNCWKIFLSNSTGYPQADRFFELMGLRFVGGQYEFCQE
jgi:N-acetylglutamate synthase-like GNAT family acetyltransferase